MSNEQYQRPQRPTTRHQTNGQSNQSPPQTNGQAVAQRYYGRSNSIVQADQLPPMHPDFSQSQPVNQSVNRDRSMSNHGFPFPFSPVNQPIAQTNNQTMIEASPPATPQLRTFLDQGATPKLSTLPPLSLSRSNSHSRNISSEAAHYQSSYDSFSQPNSPVATMSSTIPRISSASHKTTPNSAPKTINQSINQSHMSSTSPLQQSMRQDDSDERFSPQISPAGSPSLRPKALNHHTIHQAINPSVYSSNSRALSSVKTTATIRSSPRRDPVNHQHQERSNSLSSMSSSSSFSNLHLIASSDHSEPRSRHSIFHSIAMYFQRARKNYAKPERPRSKHSPPHHRAINASFHSLTSPLIYFVPFRLTPRRSLMFIAVIALFVAFSTAMFPTHGGNALLRFPTNLSYYMPSGPVSKIYAESPPSTPSFSIISLIKLPLTADGMTPEALANDKQSAQAWYSLMSWCLAVGPSNVLLYVEESSTCDWLADRPEVRGIQCHKVPALHPTYKKPLLPQLFEHAHLHSNNDIIAFMSKTAFIHPLIKTVVANISTSVSRFLLVTRRTDVELTDEVLDPYHFSRFSSLAYAFVTPDAPDYRSSYRRLMYPYIQSLDAVFDQALNHGKLHSEFGVDLFIYPKQIFDSLSLPPYLAGVYRWDNWLLSEVILRDDVDVVDASNEFVPLLVHDGLESESHEKAEGANYNDRLTKLRSGNQYKLGKTDNSDYKLDGVCPSCSLIANDKQMLAIEFAKRVDFAQSLVILTHEQPMSDEKTLLLLHNLLCWSKRAVFHNFILLVEDSHLAEHLLSLGYPVLHRALGTINAFTNQHRRVLSEVYELAKNTVDFVTFYVHVLQFVLKQNYHVFTGPSTALILDNPLNYLDHSLDVQASINTTDDSPGQSTFFAVHATTYGRDFVAKLKDCVEKQLHPITSSPPIIRTCVSTVWKAQKRNKNVKRGLLDHLRYSTSKQFFAAKLSQRAAVSASVVDLTDSLGSPKELSKLWWWLTSWKFIIYSSASNKCDRPLYPLIPPPQAPSGALSSVPQFSLKIKIIASFRPNALSRLLSSLLAASYDDDQVELELCVDGLPVVSPTAKELDKHSKVKKLVHDFQWNQGLLTKSTSYEGAANAPSSQGRGAMGAFLRAWDPNPNQSQVLLLLPDYVELSPIFYQYLKRLVQTYYLNPDMYDPQMYGISLQSHMPIMGSDQDMEHQLGGSTSLVYRYQQFGSLGTLLFPEHWREFQRFINDKGFDHSQMQLFAQSLLNGFTNSSATSALSRTNVTSMCVPGLASNSAWIAWIDKYNHTIPTNATLKFAIDHLYPLVFDRFIYERGFYALFPHLPSNGLLVEQSRVDRVRTIYSWSKEKQDKIASDIASNRVRAPSLITATPFYNEQNPPLDNLPLFDIHGRIVIPEIAQVSSEPGRSTVAHRFTSVNLDGEFGSVSIGPVTSTSSATSIHRPHSLVLAFRPYQFQTTNQCSIVKTRFVQEPSTSSTHPNDVSAAIPKRTLPVVPPTKPPTPPQPSPSTINTLLDDEGEVEARTSRQEFMKKWSEGGRRD